MSRDWQPGDVAWVTPDSECTCKPNLAIRIPGGWSFPHFPHTHVDTHVIDARPLVVIDPEDRAQVERLCMEYIRAYGNVQKEVPPKALDDMQQALREFANPAPPKPDEPLGFAAVIEDAEGDRWISYRLDGAEWVQPWHRADRDEWLDYAEIAAVRVLSEGIQ